MHGVFWPAAPEILSVLAFPFFNLRHPSDALFRTSAAALCVYMSIRAHGRAAASVGDCVSAVFFSHRRGFLRVLSSRCPSLFRICVVPFVCASVFTALLRSVLEAAGSSNASAQRSHAHFCCLAAFFFLFERDVKLFSNKKGSSKFEFNGLCIQIFSITLFRFQCNLTCVCFVLQ
jgi:hypothetical protein